VTVLEAIADPVLFGSIFSAPATWAAWRAFLAACFALSMTDDQLAVFRQHTGRQAPPAEAVREAWLIAARRPSVTTEPPSPMKILAGFQFQGKNPSATPAVAAAMSGPTLEGSMMPLRIEKKLKMKKAIEASPTTLAARPSRPSMALTALLMPNTQMTVAMGATSRVRMMNSLVNGTRRVEQGDAEEHQHRAGEDLPGDLGGRRDVADVVEGAHRGDDGAGQATLSRSTPA